MENVSVAYSYGTCDWTRCYMYTMTSWF